MPCRCIAILQLRVVEGTVKVNSAGGALLATVSSGASGAPPLQLDISFYESGIARVRITERDERTPRWEVSPIQPRMMMEAVLPWIRERHCDFSEQDFGIFSIV